MRYLLAGGGTAGHVNPLLALAEAIRQDQPDANIYALGTAEGLEARLVPERGFELLTIEKVPFPRRPNAYALKFFAKFAKAVRACRCEIRDRKIDVVVGFGGYASAPAYLAAALEKVPLVIHEANARPGIANRLGALLTPHTAITHSIGSGKLSKALLAGLPLREDVVSAYRSASHDWRKARADAKRQLGFDEAKPLVFIFGGSQGSVCLLYTSDAADE